VSSGSSHGCALTGEGWVACWGSNELGQVGDGTTTNTASSQAVNTAGVLADKTVIQVQAGNVHSCALTSDSVVACWGSNEFGQLGNGPGPNSSVPVAVDRTGVLAGTGYFK